MKWAMPPTIKIYEALGAIGDGRIEVDGNQATVSSSSGGKSYSVVYDADAQAITANDNGSYYQGYLGYPAIAFLLLKGLLPYDEHWASALRGFAWKDINVRNKNDWKKTEAFIRESLVEKGEDLGVFDQEIERIRTAVQALDLNRLPSAAKPPQAY